MSLSGGSLWLSFGFAGLIPRPSYHPSVLLKLYIYGYLNRIQSSRRLERETCRNVEVMWWVTSEQNYLYLYARQRLSELTICSSYYLL